MDFLREYQALIGLFSTALLASMGGLYKLFSARQLGHETRIDRVLQDHEQRIRQSVAKSDWERLVEEVRGMKKEMHDAIAASCAHNEQTRDKLQGAIMETERRLGDKIDAYFGRRGS
jgi:hypothetical protein